MTTTASFYEEIEYGELKPILKVMLKTPYTKEVRITFRKGQEMKEHKAPYPIVVQVLEGRINFGIEQNERIILEKGVMITLDANIYHDLIADEESIVRLSVNTKNS